MHRMLALSVPLLLTPLVVGASLVENPALSTASAAADASGSVSSEPVLATGRVVDTLDGDVVPVADALVTVAWLPGRRDARPGDRIRTVVVDRSRTTADGTYAVTAAPTARMRAEAARNGGWITFDVSTASLSSGRTDFTTISRRLVRGRWTADSGAVPVVRPLKDVGVAQGALRTADAAEAPYVNSATAPSTDILLDDGPEAGVERRAAVSCTYVLDGTPRRSVSVIEFHNASNSDAGWSYGRTADSNVDSGISDGHGNWRVGASYRVSNSNSARVGMNFTGRVNSFARTSFEWYDGRYTHPSARRGTPCAGPPGFTFEVGSGRRDVKEWYGGVGMNGDLPGAEYLGCDTGTRTSHRINLPVNAFFERDSENAAKISGAVNLGPISVGADSGYSTNVSMRWTAKRGRGIWLCGTNSAPTTAGVIHAQNRP